MGKRDDIKEMLRPPKKGIEIGASIRPVAPKREGFDVVVVDHATCDVLKNKYKDNPGASLIEDVDVIWRGEPLDTLPGFEVGRYDFIVAAHLFEHLPNPLLFFESCSKLLNENGKIHLFIPDKRRCFDFTKHHLDVANVIQRYYNECKKHDFETVFRAYNEHVSCDGRCDWGIMPICNIRLAGDAIESLRIASAAVQSSEYVDVHSNFLTPASFQLLMVELNYLELTKLMVQGDPIGYGCEFYVCLEKRPDYKYNKEHYKKAKTHFQLMIFDELLEQIERLRESQQWRDYALWKRKKFG